MTNSWRLLEETNASVKKYIWSHEIISRGDVSPQELHDEAGLLGTILCCGGVHIMKHLPFILWYMYGEPSYAPTF